MFNKLLSKYLLLILLLVASISGQAQTPKRICVMGSSSAYGYFPNTSIPRDSAWAFKVGKYYKDLGVIDSVYNIGTPGIDCYTGMPTSYVPPPGRYLPNPEFNITRAVNFVPKPDVIIVNFPSNNYTWLSITEILFCLQTIKDSANAKGILCFISTSQPRDDFNMIERQKLMDIKQAIESTFGVWAIDFYSGTYNPPSVPPATTDLGIKTIYSLGDLVHFNPVGHSLLASRVITKNIFSFAPVAAGFGTVNAVRQGSKALVNWQVYQEVNNERFLIQKSHNGIDFIDIASVPSYGNSNSGRTYSFVDQEAGNGNNYYRIAAVDHSGRYQYSAVVLLKAVVQQGIFVYPTITKDKLSIFITSDKKETVQIRITDIHGKVVMFKKAQINNNEVFPLIVSHLAAGTYILTAEYSGKVQSLRFMKI